MSVHSVNSLIFARSTDGNINILKNCDLREKASVALSRRKVVEEDYYVSRERHCNTNLSNRQIEQTLFNGGS